MYEHWSHLTSLHIHYAIILLEIKKMPDWHNNHKEVIWKTVNRYFLSLRELAKNSLEYFKWYKHYKHVLNPENITQMTVHQWALYKLYILKTCILKTISYYHPISCLVSHMPLLQCYPIRTPQKFIFHFPAVTVHIPQKTVLQKMWMCCYIIISKFISSQAFLMYCSPCCGKGHYMVCYRTTKHLHTRPIWPTNNIILLWQVNTLLHY